MILVNHPRPDFRRTPFVDLTGVWKFKFDNEKADIASIKIFEHSDMDIKVPYPYQSELSGIGTEDEHDVVWYGRTFTVSSNDLDKYKTWLLKFGAVDYETQIWLNGKLVGSHIGGYDSFSFDVSSIISKQNELIIKVIDRHLDQPRGKQAEHGTTPKDIIYTRVTGIWQPVWIEPIAGKTYIDKFFLRTTLDGTLSIKAFIKGDITGPLTLDVSITHGAARVNDFSFEVKNNTLEATESLDDVYLWSPDEPNLYDITLTLKKENTVLDEVKSYFGIREVRIKDDKILLNNKPIYLELVLDQGYYPEGIYTPKCVTDFLKDLQAVQQLGFNGVRAHQKPPDPRYLYVADSLGILVWEEMADWGMSLTKKNLQTFLEQWKNIILRDFNHPSIITWVPLNERDEPSESAEAKEFVESVYDETKKIDPTRPVVDTSGWTHVKTDIFDVHDYIFSMHTGNAYKEILLSSEDLWWPSEEESDSETVDPNSFDFALPGAYKHQPLVISEFGGWGIEGQKPIVKREVYAYAKVPDSFRLAMKYLDIVTAIATARNYCGFCYTQLYDVEGELNGLMTYDRKWKVDPEKIRAANKKALAIWSKEKNE